MALEASSKTLTNAPAEAAILSPALPVPSMMTAIAFFNLFSESQTSILATLLQPNAELQ
ncbi:MAG: hypothetical protein HUJ51_06870 [Eggerthellaceae bacterium]|nr:hypothetical protein [Eggerthellaceae bacterium]